MRKLIREPFLHFLLLGAVIFIAHRFVSERAEIKPGKIVITKGEIASLVTGFARTWQRPPSREELGRLVTDRVREEVYYREARAMGLDQDDTIIRRRLRQKLEFVTEDVAAVAEPSEAELAEYLAKHSEVFRVDRRLTFSHVYFDPAKHGETLAEEVSQLLVRLRDEARDLDLSSLGDSSLLPQRFDATPVTELAKQLGEKFAAILAESSVGQWVGPVESGYGLHLVFVEKRTEGHLPELAEVRDAVRREWTHARRLESNEKFFQGLLKHYEVVVEQLNPAEAGEKFANAK